MSKKNTDISKFLSYVLRHQPEAIGLSLDNEGWAIISDLILCSVKEGYILDNNLLRNIVDNSDKKRFTISDDGLHIRAAQGHSTQQVNIAYTEKKPPDILYHGTASRFISAIREQGLIPLSRQYVHLSSDEDTAIQVGQRHGKPVVLKIKALNMWTDPIKLDSSC
jgi:putative RNA 2'-phosphotransferase